MTEHKENKIFKVKVSEIEADDEFLQYPMDEEDINSTVESIKDGEYDRFDFPVLLWETHEEKLQLIFGHEFFEAVKRMGSETVFAKVKEFGSHDEAIQAVELEQKEQDEKRIELNEDRAARTWFMFDHIRQKISETNAIIEENPDATDEELIQKCKQKNERIKKKMG